MYAYCHPLAPSLDDVLITYSDGVTESLYTQNVISMPVDNPGGEGRSESQRDIIAADRTVEDSLEHVV